MTTTAPVPLRSDTRFDWAEAHRLHTEEGLSYRAIACRFGVSYNGVWRVLSNVGQARAKHAANRTPEENRERLLKPCRICGKPAWATRSAAPRCAPCAADAVTTSVRRLKLRCTRCRRWLPDEAFPRQKAAIRRRGRHSTCTACNTEERRERRRRGAS